MSKKRKLLIVVLALIVLLLNVLLVRWHSDGIRVINFDLTVSSDAEGTVEVRDAETMGGWLGERTASGTYNSENEETAVLTFGVRSDMQYVRIDTGMTGGQKWVISDMTISGQGTSDTLDLSAIVLDPATESHDLSMSVENGALVIETLESDPYFSFAVSYPNVSKAVADKAGTQDLIVKALALVILDGLFLALILFRNKLLALPIEVFQNRALIVKLAKNDFKTKYAGSYLGIFWAFVQPVVTVLVYWVVFGIGLKAGSASNVPFVVYLTSGIVPWFYLQEVLTSGTNAMIEYSYLVKKVVFKISILPMVKAISAFFVHAFFVLVAVVIAALHGIYPSVYLVQVIYYFICMFVFSLAIIYGTCAVVIFFRDLSQIISIILQIGIWTVPIMWNISIAPANMQWIFKLNPMFYIVSGYRNAIYNHVWFWQDLKLGVYFWAVTLVLFGLGTVIFKRLKIHFADVL